MRTPEDIETYLLELGHSFDQVDEGMWVLQDDEEHLENLVIHYAAPLAIFRVKLFDLPEGDNGALYRQLLELNANDLVHGAYGLEGNSVVLIDTLQVENLDRNELQASIEAISMALTQHYPVLSSYRNGRGAN